MKKLIIAILLLIGVSACTTHFSSGNAIVDEIKKVKTSCQYVTYFQGDSYRYIAVIVNDSCGKFRVGDTIYATNKKP